MSYFIFNMFKSFNSLLKTVDININNNQSLSQ